MIFITGASGGIGRACAEAFASRGRALWIVARRLDRLEELRSQLISRHRAEVVCHRLDVSSRQQVEDFFSLNTDLMKKTEVVVNNAGLTRGLDPIQAGSIDDWEVTIDTNIKGLLYVTRGFLPGFVAEGRGHVINIGSVASRWTYPRGNVYCATKRAVSSLTEAMRLDLLGTGVRVSEVSPGLVETDFSLGRFKGDRERASAVYKNTQCLRPEDVAEAVVWVAERPPHVNVQEVVVYPTNQASTNHFYRP